MKRFLFYIFLLFLACYCTKIQDVQEEYDAPLSREPILADVSTNQKLDGEAYTTYIEEKANGLIKEKQISDFTFSLFYKPLEYQALVGLKNQHPAKADFDREMSEIKDMQYFTFKIEVANFNQELLKYNLESPEQYEQRVNYFAFKIQNDFKLIEGKDTLDCELFHFERNYGVAPTAHFVLAFPAIQNGNKIFDKTLSYDDKTFGMGTININIDKTQLAKLPVLNLE